MLVLAAFLLSSCALPGASTDKDAYSAPLREPPSPHPTDTKKEQKNSPETGLIGWYETKLFDAGRPRITNITLAMRKINGKIIKPGEEFSFNNTVGRRTVSRGYKKATIFKKNKEVKEVGGGICQLSSTLFCAVRQAGLEITERHEHQLPVDYVKQGDDATVYFGRLDFKFINSMDVPVKIICDIKERKVRVGIYAVK
ncbi:MAG: VanW family protein [Clostridiales bacterium]|nr:VanW family protein [Clostridiales bacterium]